MAGRGVTSCVNGGGTSGRGSERGSGRLRATLGVLRAAGGDVARVWRGRGADVARRRAEQAAFLELMLEEIEDAIYVQPADGGTPTLNRAARHMLGTDARPGVRLEEQPAHFRAYHADGRTPLSSDEQPVVKALAGVRTEAMTIIIKRPDRGPRHTVWSAAPLRGEAGGIIAAVAVGHDLTDLIATQNEAQRIRELSGDVFLEIDDEGRLVRGNPAYRQVLGRAAREDAGRAVADLIHPDDRASNRRLRERLASGDRPVDHEERWHHADGSWRWLSWNLVPQPERGVVHGVGRDVTARRRQRQELLAAVEELRRSNRELEDFAGVASHDLQEPLRKIRAFGERLANRLGGDADPQVADHLKRMTGAAGRMQTLIDDLLTFSRVRSRAGEPARVELGEVAREVLGDLDTTQAQIDIGPLPAVDADPTQMRQLLQNLIANAIKFRKPGGPARVEVSGGVEEGRAVVRVRDQGIGFDPAYAEKIFDIFQRLHGRGEYDGTGIGLAVCRKIVARHGGTITARSTPGAGAEFEVPAAVGAGRGRGRGGGRGGGGGGGRRAGRGGACIGGGGLIGCGA